MKPKLHVSYLLLFHSCRFTALSSLSAEKVFRIIKSFNPDMRNQSEDRTASGLDHDNESYLADEPRKGGSALDLAVESGSYSGVFFRGSRHVSLQVFRTRANEDHIGFLDDAVFLAGFLENLRSL